MGANEKTNREKTTSKYDQDTIRQFVLILLSSFCELYVLSGGAIGGINGAYAGFLATQSLSGQARRTQ